MATPVRGAILSLLAALLAVVCVVPTASHAQVVVSPVSAQVFGGGTVRAIVVQPDGKVIVGGSFSHVNGVARDNLARLNSDGSLDSNWNPQAVGDGTPDYGVNAMVLDGSGNLFVAGSYSTSGGMAGFLVKIPTSGSGAADPAWNPFAGGFGFASVLALDGSGNLYVAGAFSSIGGQAIANLARVSTSGSGAADSMWKPAAFDYISALALDGNGFLYVGHLGSRLVRFSTSAEATLDPTWNPSPDSAVYALALDGSGAIFVGGTFSRIGGLARSGLAKVSIAASGPVDPTWTPDGHGNVDALALDGNDLYVAGYGFAKVSATGAGAVDAAWDVFRDGPIDGPIRCLAVGPTKLYVGGYFTTIGGQSKGGIASLAKTTASVDVAGPMVLVPATVNAISRDASGRMVLGGRFIAVGGSARRNIARLNPDGGVDATWAPDADGEVRALAHGLDDNLYVGGLFGRIGGQVRNRVAKVSTSTGLADATWNPDADGTVEALALDDSGDSVFVGGAFSVIGGLLRNRMAKVSSAGVGAVDAAWNPSLPARPIGAFLRGDAGSLFVASSVQFSSNQLGVVRVAQVGTGAVDPTWNVVGLTGGVSALVRDASGNLFVGGGIYGSSSTQYHLAKLAGSGAPDGGWSAGTDVLGEVFALAVSSSGTLYVGGDFTTLAGQPRASLGSVSAAGSGAITAWNPAADGIVRAIAFDGSGQVCAGGSFTMIAGQSRSGYACHAAGPGPPTINAGAPRNRPATVAFSPPIDSGGSPIVSYTARCNSGAVTQSATGPISPITVTGLTNNTTYTCTVNATNSSGDGPPSNPAAVTPDVPQGLGSFAFGGQSMGTTSPGSPITFAPNGPVTVTAIIVTTAQFTQTSNCATLVAGQSCTIHVTFSPGSSPGALNSTQTVSGQLLIVTNQGVFAIDLSGTAEKSLVSHYYRSILRRAPDAGGHAFWSGEAARVAGLGANVNETWYVLAATFYRSGEYVAQNRNTTEYISDLYNTFFNRAADGGGLAFWTGQINAGLPREVALTAFMFSGEFASFTQAISGSTPARAEVDAVVDFYRGLLGRLPDGGGFNFWVGRFRTAQCQGASAVTSEVEAISSAFALSGEYAARGRDNTQYVGDLYNAFLRRGGDLGGFQFWVNQIAGGFRTREQVRIEFKNSPEFQGRVNAMINQGCM